MTEAELEQIMEDGQKLVRSVSKTMTELYGPGYLTSADPKQFTIEAGALGYAINNLQVLLSSLLIERMVYQGDTEDEAHEQVVAGMVHDASGMANMGLERYQEGLALAKALLQKKSTNH